MTQKILGHIVDIISGTIFHGTIEIENGKIVQVSRDSIATSSPYIIPGLIDAHVHIESSMLTPVEFARIAVTHGTVGALCDPHEIANVLGITGLDFMLESGKGVPFHFYWGVPSCVPATPFETSGAVLDAKTVSELLASKNFSFLSEVMNVPGVLYDDPEVLQKIQAAKMQQKPIDGHSPTLSGDGLRKYIAAGISTDHECTSLEEAREKASLGMYILIREGSAAKDFNSLIEIAREYPNQVMFCSDDKHPDELLHEHINLLVKRAITIGIDPIVTLRAASLNPVKHYNLDIGLLQEGDNADFVVVDNLTNLNILETYINGKLVTKDGQPLIEKQSPKIVNNFLAEEILPSDLCCPPQGEKIRVIKLIKDEIITEQTIETPLIENNNVISNTSDDTLKIVVINRYKKSKPAIGFVKGFGLKRGAIASSIAHDCHNIIAVGTSDDEITNAINLVISNKGAIACVDGENINVLPLPIAGIISDQSATQVATLYETLNGAAKSLGCILEAPYMTLSFLALVVIPKLKLSDQGLFDGEKFEFTKLFI